MTLAAPRKGLGGDPQCPAARNGCTCLCHRVPGIMHMFDCCEQVHPATRTTTDTPTGAELLTLADVLQQRQRNPVMTSDSTPALDLKAKLELLLEFNDQLSALKTMINQVQDLSPEEIQYLRELIAVGTQQPSLPSAEQSDPKTFKLGDKVTYEDAFKALCYPFSFGTRFYKEAIVACLSPFVLVANPDPDQTVARWTAINPKELKVIGRASDGEFIRTRKVLTEQELVSTGETTRLDVN